MMRLAPIAARPGHLDEHLPIPLYPLLEQRLELLLARHELFEGLAEPRGGHRRLLMPAHRQVPVSRHPLGRRLQLRGTQVGSFFIRNSFVLVQDSLSARLSAQHIVIRTAKRRSALSPYPRSRESRQ
jgi:hypothetical protein